MSERFKLVYNKDELGYMIIDTEDDLRDDIHAWNLLCDLLNQQDKRIKEFEDFMKEEEFTGLEDLKAYIKLQSNAFKNLIQENQELKQSVENLQKLNGEIITLNRTVIKDSQILVKENEQLKQSQKQKME